MQSKARNCFVLLLGSDDQSIWIRLNLKHHNKDNDQLSKRSRIKAEKKARLISRNIIKKKLKRKQFAVNGNEKAPDSEKIEDCIRGWHTTKDLMAFKVYIKLDENAFTSLK